MKRLIQAAAGMTMMLLAACGGVTPAVTPTVAPTTTAQTTTIAQLPSRTPLPLPTTTESATPLPPPTITPLPTATATATLFITATFTPSPTLTSPVTTSATVTASATATDLTTRTPVVSPTVTLRPTLTATPPPTLTPTPIPTLTPVPSVTPFFSPTPLPTLTPAVTLSQTITPTQSATPAPTSTPFPTLTATIDGTRVVADLLTREAQISPTWTLVPPASPTSSLVPTLNVTPTFITATPGADTIGVLISPIPSTPVAATAAPTITLLPTLIPPPPTDAPIPTDAPNFPPRPFGGVLSNAGLQAADFNFAPGTFGFNEQAVPGGVALFAANPQYGESYARVDQAGNLAFVPPNGSGEQVISSSPFFRDQPFAGDAASNGDRITDIVWSPDGTKLAFMIYALPGTNTGDTGVWVWNGGTAIKQSADCPDDSNYARACEFAADKTVNNYVTTHIQWRADSAATLNLYNAEWEGRTKRAFAVVPLQGEYVGIAPALFFWDSASYLQDGRLLVSGEDPQGQWTVATMGLKPDGQPDQEQLEVLLDADAAGVWIDSAVQRPDGVIVAFGKPGQPDGPLALGIVANGSWTQLGPFIGGSYPTHIEWSGNNGQAVVSVDGGQVVVNAQSGEVQPLNP